MIPKKINNSIIMKYLWILAISVASLTSVFAQREVAAVGEISTNNELSASGDMNVQKDVLILLAHPNMAASKANAAMIEAVKDYPFVRIINIYEAPFEAATYTAAFREAKHIVFQFPFYWASAPHLLKKWCDEIFGAIMADPGVKGKTLTVATTTGSEYEAYRSGGRNLFTIDELLRPYQVLAHHSGMVWQTPFVIYGTSLPDADKRIKEGATAYRGKMNSIRNNEK